MMVPTMVFDGSKMRAVIGAPGGTKIVTGVLQTILNVFDHGMTAVEAVSSPRVDYQVQTVEIEGRVPTSVVTGLRSMGYDVHQRLRNYDPYFALVQVLLVAPDGTIGGASDPRNDGGAAFHLD
jgi:gamma-glutamyltranspeptidase/glutathione hydrolase